MAKKFVGSFVVLRGNGTERNGVDKDEHVQRKEDN